MNRYGKPPPRILGNWAQRWLRLTNQGVSVEPLMLSNGRVYLNYGDGQHTPTSHGTRRNVQISIASALLIAASIVTYAFLAAPSAPHPRESGIAKFQVRSAKPIRSQVVRCMPAVGQSFSEYLRAHPGVTATRDVNLGQLRELEVSSGCLDDDQLELRLTLRGGGWQIDDVEAKGDPASDQVTF